MDWITQPRMHSRTGYTFIEIVTVVLVMGIVSAVAAPRFFSSLATARVDAAAKRIVADLALAQAEAIAKGAEQEAAVRFYPASDEYHLVDVTSADRSGDAYWVDLQNTGYPVDLVSVAFTNTLGSTSYMTIQFDHHGNACSGSSTVAPLASGQIVIASGSVQRTIVIDPLTGKAEVQ